MWNTALAELRSQLAPHTYDVWFAPIQCEHYDERSRNLVLRLPSRYIYEYIEQYQTEILSAVITKVYGKGVQVSYRITDETFVRTVDLLQRQGAELMPRPVRISLPNAAERLRGGLNYFLGDDRVQWLPAYDKVAEWLSDNQGRGLLLCGSSGLGKSLICQRILPVLFGSQIKCVSAIEMNSQIDSLLTERCVVIDDLGKESVEAWVNYQRRRPFLELLDAAERRGNLVIITSNLSTTPMSSYPGNIQERYGSEVLSRLRALVKAIEIKGKDLR